MAQGVLPFQYKEHFQTPGLTALAGLPAYLDLAHAAGLRDAIRRHLHVLANSHQGWFDEQIVMALILLNLVGGESVADLEQLEADEGSCQLLRQVEYHGLPRSEPRYNFHSAIAGWFYRAGGIMLLVELLAIPIILKKIKQTGANKAKQRIEAERDKN